MLEHVNKNTPKGNQGKHIIWQPDCPFMIASSFIYISLNFEEAKIAAGKARAAVEAWPGLSFCVVEKKEYENKSRSRICFEPFRCRVL